MRDLINCLDFKRGLSPAAAVTNNTAFVSQIFDTRGMSGALFAFATGSLADTDATFTVLAEEGDNASLTDNTAVADANLLGTEALAAPLFSDDNKVFKLGFVDTKRYLRVTITPANNTGDVYIAGMWIGCPLIRPSANPPA